MRAMLDREISFGQTASHSPMFEQPPKPSESIWATIRCTRLWLSGWPCGSKANLDTKAPTNREADPVGQAATQAPQPIQDAESIAASATDLGTNTALASGAPPVLTEI